jgi:hypothetical protein
MFNYLAVAFSLIIFKLTYLVVDPHNLSLKKILKKQILVRKIFPN